MEILEEAYYMVFTAKTMFYKPGTNLLMPRAAGLAIDVFDNKCVPASPVAIRWSLEGLFIGAAVRCGLRSLDNAHSMTAFREETYACMVIWAKHVLASLAVPQAALKRCGCHHVKHPDPVFGAALRVLVWAEHETTTQDEIRMVLEHAINEETDAVDAEIHEINKDLPEEEA
jgi:hypothetical protein